MVETVKLTEEVAEGRGDISRRAISMRRLRIAQALAFVGLVAALVGALGPADKIRTVYSWPPAALPEGSPNRVWYTPLLLTRRAPESVAASLPCSVVPALPKAGNPAMVLATARYPESVGGLSVTRRDKGLTVAVGDDVLARVPLATSPAGDETCAYRLHITNLRWSIEGGPDAVLREGGLESMPVVNGLFSGVHLRPGTPPAVDITTAPHQVRPLFRQKLAWVIAALAIAAALILTAMERWPSSLSSKTKGQAYGALRHARLADVVVGVTLAGWWLIAPAHWDDGWVMARQSGFSTSGGFSNYYDSFGVNFPNGYWLEWLQHWVTQTSSSLVLVRLPALLCLAATWLLCRWILTRVLASSERDDRFVLWAFTSSFVVGALAWGMTLRPEPVSALIVTGAMACTVRFLERRSTAPLAVLAILGPLAVTAHHAGILAMASVLVVAPQLLEWARAHAAAAATIATTTVSLFVVLAFVGADVGQRSADAHVFGTYGVADAWYDEFRRYAYLSDENGGTPLKRGSFALIALVVLVFVFRRGRKKRPLLDLPAATLALSLVMLVVVPSKWPWHFGTLLGIAAVAAAAETARLREETTRSTGWQVRPFLAVSAVLLAIAWSWGPRERWTILDLRTLDWRLGFEQQFPLTVLAAALPLLLLALLLARRRGGAMRGRAPWVVAGASAPLVVIPLVLFTAAVLVADGMKTSSWTLARQNVDTLRGDAGCGLADDVLIAARSSMRPLAEVAGSKTVPAAAWVPHAPVAGLSRFALGPTGEEGTASTPWFELSAGRNVGVFVAGPWAASDSVALEWGHLSGGGRIEFLGASSVRRDLRSSVAGVSPWRFVELSELDVVPESSANAVRVTLQSQSAPGAALAVTAPVTYSSEEFGRRLEQDGVRALVGPGLRPYFPCATQPRLHNGIAEVPRYVVAPSDSVSPLTYPTSPFLGLLDVFEFHRLSSVPAPGDPDDVAIYEVDQQIPGATQAPPSTTTSTS